MGEPKMGLPARKRTAVEVTQFPANRARTKSVPVPNPSGEADEERKDYFITRNGVTFAGSHLILDLWGASDLDDEAKIEKALKEAVTAAGATLLHIHLHKFSPNGGVSGVAVLSESHISVHTWPEKGFAAFDVIMCGAAQPTKTIAVLEAAFRPDRVVVGEHKRGIV
jgi:S-adenosylmethionine decarboxylase